MKKICLLFLFVFLPLAANADAVEIDGIYYDLVSKVKVAEVTSNPNQYSGKIVIPEKITYEGLDYDVTTIGDNAFFYSSLTSITIPNGVTSIGNSAFSWCSRLTSVIIPNSVQSIGRDAFLGCSRLSSLTIPYGLTSIEYSSFSHCSSLTSLIIPNSVTSISDLAFSNCSSLTSLTISENVKSIGNSAFIACSGLTSVTIPNNVLSINSSAFEGCSSLTTVAIGCGVVDIGGNAFAKCPELTDIYCYATNVPNTASNAFTLSYPENTTLHVPSASVSAYSNTDPWDHFGTIESYTPEPINLGCVAIDGIWYELTVTGEKRTAVIYEPMDSNKPTGDWVIPSSIVSSGKTYSVVGIRTLRGCEGLTSVTIYEGITKIDRAAFDECTNLKMVKLPESLVEIGDYAFYNLGKLEQVNIPQNVTYIGDEAFCECNNLNIQVESLEGWFNIVLSTASSEYPFDKNCNLHLFKDGQEVVDLVIPNGVNALRTRAFYRFTALTSISIPISMTSVGTNAFNGCNSMTDVYVDKEEPLTIGSTTFSNSSKATLHVPLGCRDAYLAADYWKGFKEIVEVTDQCPTPTITANDGKLSFSCKLEGVEYHYDITSKDSGTGNSVEVPVSTTYTLAVYATKDGYKSSNVATTMLTIPQGDMNHDGKITVADAVKLVDVILTNP